MVKENVYGERVYMGKSCKKNKNIFGCDMPDHKVHKNCPLEE